jgi:microcystin-dependent protein
LPTHTHGAHGSSANGNSAIPTNTLLSKVEGVDAYQPPTNLVAMAPSMVSTAGGSQAHLNMQPFLTLTFCIALQGIFPSPN